MNKDLQSNSQEMMPIQHIVCFKFLKRAKPKEIENLKASFIMAKVSLRSSAIVIIAITPDYRQSYNMKAVPFRDSRSNEIDCNRHMWKNDLY